MLILVKGVEWLLKFARLRGRADGWCYFKERKILVHQALRGERRLDVVLHELLHAHFPELSEEDVTQSASEIAEVLWNLGYRGLDEA